MTEDDKVLVKRLRGEKRYKAQDDHIIAEPHLLSSQAADHIEAQAVEIERLRGVLHCISLGSQDSGTTKEQLGREARAALGDTQ